MAFFPYSGSNMLAMRAGSGLVRVRICIEHIGQERRLFLRRIGILWVIVILSPEFKIDLPEDLNSLVSFMCTHISTCIPLLE
jgi:hypothetical protein